MRGLSYKKAIELSIKKWVSNIKGEDFYSHNYLNECALCEYFASKKFLKERYEFRDTWYEPTVSVSLIPACQLCPLKWDNPKKEAYSDYDISCLPCSRNFWHYEYYNRVYYSGTKSGIKWAKKILEELKKITIE